MENKKGFTLVELIAVIVLVGFIALIITPKITQVLQTQKMNIFEDSVEGIVKAVKEDTINNTGFNSTTGANYRAYTYDGTGLYLTVAGNQSTETYIKISGGIDDGEGTVVVTKNSDVILAVYNGKYCATKNADDTNVTVEKFTGSCVNDEIDIPEAPSCFTTENNPDNTLTITGYDYNNSSCSKDLVIPNRINGKKVTKIADLAFVDAETIIAEYMELDINGNEHWYDEYLENFPSDKTAVWMTTTTADNVTGKYCFTDMNENNDVSVGLNYVHTTDDGYYSCYFDYANHSAMDENGYQLDSIDFSNASGLSEIPFGLAAFSSVMNVKIGDYITKINSMAFTGNYITKLSIPKSVQQIGSYSFNGNQIFNLDFTNASALRYIDEGAFTENSLSTLKIENLSNLISINGGGYGAFEDNNLTTVTLRNLPSLTSIGSMDDEYGPFNYNNILTIVLDNLPNLKTIGNNAFYSNGFTSITIPSSVELIGEKAFGTCGCSGSPTLETIVNKTGRSFDWSLIIDDGTTATCSFITGTCSTVNITS